MRILRTAARPLLALVAMAALLSGVAVTASPTPAHADTVTVSPETAAAWGDNYGWKDAQFPACNSYDTWGFCKRYCTSWVAQALANRNGFNLPYNSGQIGNASNWGTWAGNAGYTVDMTPAIGSVAWWSGANHVAWVRSVSGNNVEVEEYNNPAGSGNYSRRTINKTSVSGYIHFRDITISTNDTQAPGQPSGPAAAVQYDLQAVVSWGASTDNVGVAGYDISRDGLFVGSTTGLSYTDVPPAQGKTYTYSVVARDAAGNRSAPSTASVVLPDYARGSLEADFNGDGKDDVVNLGNPTGGSDLMVYLSTGSTFQTPQQWWHGVGWRWEYMKAMTGDFNGDGLADVANLGTPGTGGSDLMVFLSTGFAFQTPQQWWAEPTWDWSGMKPVAADVNGDGKDDIVSLGRPGNGGSDLMVMLSNGSGFNAPQQWWANTGWGWNTMRIVAGDFNGDGKDDVVNVGKTGNDSDFMVFLSTGSGFATPSQWWLGSGWNWAGMKPFVGDFNGDGKADMANLGLPGNGSDLMIFISNGSSFATPQQWWLGVGWNWQGMKMRSADVNGDGKSDAVNLGNPTGGSDLMVYTSSGTTFATPSQWWLGTGWDWNGMRLA